MQSCKQRKRGVRSHAFVKNAASGGKQGGWVGARAGESGVSEIHEKERKRRETMRLRERKKKDKNSAACGSARRSGVHAAVRCMCMDPSTCATSTLFLPPGRAAPLKARACPKCGPSARKEDSHRDMGRETPSTVHQVLVEEILPRQHPLDQAPELGHVLDPYLRMHTSIGARPRWRRSRATAQWADR